MIFVIFDFIDEKWVHHFLPKAKEHSIVVWNDWFNGCGLRLFLIKTFIFKITV